MNPHEFADWLTLTRETTVLGPSEVVNAAQKFQNMLVGRMLTVNPLRKVMSAKGGTSISERIKLTRSGRFGAYTPGAQGNFGRAPTKARIRAGWRYLKSDVAWTDADVILNGGTDPLVAYKDFKASLLDDGWDDHWTGMEETLWARPNFALMEPESVSNGLPYSVLAIVTENETGAGAWRAPGWGDNTLMGQNPTTMANWRNPIERYNDADPFDLSTGLFVAFDRMTMRTNFYPPKGGGKGSSAFEKNNADAQVIVTNLDGRTMYQRQLRAGNDSYRAGGQDPSYAGPMWMGKPVEHAAGLDQALLDENAGVYSGTPYPDGKPRYLFLNLYDIFPRYHPERLFTMSEVLRGSLEEEDTYGLNWKSWGNLICVNRRTSGVIAPQSAR